MCGCCRFIRGVSDGYFLSGNFTGGTLRPTSVTLPMSRSGTLTIDTVVKAFTLGSQVLQITSGPPVANVFVSVEVESGLSLQTFRATSTPSDTLIEL